MIFNAPKESIKEEDEEYNDVHTGTHGTVMQKKKSPQK